jgi:adenylate kinase family enzyme
MRRVLVLGCAGAGKTTLARTLGERTGLPVMHLDRHYWRPGWVEPDKETWRRQVGELLAQPSWIMDGNYGGTVAVRLAQADTAIFLDFSTWRCLWRVVKRIAVGYGRSRPDLADDCPEHVDFAFLLYVLRFRRRSRPNLEAALAGFGGRLVRLTAPGQVRRYLATLPSQQLPAGTRPD